MEIENPGLVLPIIFLFLMAGIGLCLFILVKAMRRGKQPLPEKKPKNQQSLLAGYIRQFMRWMAEPATIKKQPPQKDDLKLKTFPAVSLPSEESFEVMRVLRVGSKGRLRIEVGGVQYTKISDINDTLTERRIMVAIQELYDLLRMPQDKRQIVEPAPLDKPTPVQLIQEPPIPSNTFIDQIESLLQQRLVLHPILKSRSIHISDNSAGDLGIKVDEIQYENIEDIPEKEIATFLRETLEIWERS